MSFQPFTYRIDQKNNTTEYGGSRYSGFVSPVQLGLTFTGKKFLFSAGARYNWRNRFDYYLSPEILYLSRLVPGILILASYDIWTQIKDIPVKNRLTS
jgi:hypothetical protein